VLLRPTPISNATEENAVDPVEDTDATENGEEESTDNNVIAIPITDDENTEDSEVDIESGIDASDNSDGNIVLDSESNLETQSTNSGGGPLDIFVLLAGIILLLLVHSQQKLNYQQ